MRMKQQLRYICLTICALVASVAMMAQTHPDCPLDTIRGKIYYRYTVEKSVGLYRISVNFGVSQEEILRANPELQKRGLRYGEEILVPAKDLPATTLPMPQPSQPVVVASLVEEQPKSQPVEEEKPANLQPTSNQPPTKADEELALLGDMEPPIDDTLYNISGVDTVAMDSLVMDSTAIRLAVMLPFHTHAVKREKDMERFYDFYAGVLIAVNEVQAAGQPIEVYTYDVGKTAHKVSEVLEQPQMHRMDAIIGPVYNAQVETAAEFAQRDSTLLLVPFISHIEGIAHNPYILQFNPSEQTEADTLARYLAQRGDSVNCVLIETKEGESVPAGVVALHRALAEYRVPTTTTSIRAILQDSLDGVLRPNVENIFVFNTERYGNLQALLPHLSLAAQAYPITLFSRYSWQRQNIPFPQIYTSVFSLSPSVSDYYEDTFRQYFDHELVSHHPRFDLLGYDLARHLLHIVQTLRADGHADMPTVIAEDVFYGTQSNIRYKHLGEQGGYENENIHIIRK